MERELTAICELCATFYVICNAQMKFPSIYIIIFFLTSCKTQHLISKPQCDYLGLPIRNFTADILKPIVDTIPSTQYTGSITSLFLKMDKKITFEVVPELNGAIIDSTSRPLNYNYYFSLPIKCIFLLKSGEVKKYCGCKELADWKNNKHTN